ncbi:ribosome small subunit-dependent GTPase A [Anaerosinus massiliensis]|uniref:ribosome small subunit-dependent GTPase A n=1 Tax=Massilibacillus massiliensis TaxID=1806837 RepID=UPI000AD08909|nr:ribosome small subunit-dependent GTPase A [Massilibacillus massiliensis]
MQNGVVIKTLNSYYYVQTEHEVIRCKIRGRFKRERFLLCVGDQVTYQLLEDHTGIIESIMPRNTLLKRPFVANVDQVIVTFAAKNPDINLLLIDRFLVLAEHSNLKILLCVNKCDLADVNELNSLIDLYTTIGYEVIKVSAQKNIGIDLLKEHLQNKVSVFSGPSGVGKSTLLNVLNPKFQLLTGSISNKIKRGKHTTRVAELFPLFENSFVVDTPGFSFTEFKDIDKFQLSHYFPEFREIDETCKFNTCLHDHEPQCAIKQAVKNKSITKQRYTSYLSILNEIKDIKREF